MIDIVALVSNMALPQEGGELGNRNLAIAPGRGGRFGQRLAGKLGNQAYARPIDVLRTIVSACIDR